MKGKQTKIHSHRNLHSAKKVVRVTHSDVCGPMSTPFMGGSIYYISFVDEFSGYVTIYPIAKKSDMLNTFKLLLPWFERKFSCTLHILHSDQVGEYLALNSFLQERVIEQSFAPAYSPDHNGIAERLNWTVIEGTRSLLSQSSISRKFWAEAVAHMANIRNHFFCPRSSDQTSYEMATGSKHRVDHLRAFGCLVWVHVPKNAGNLGESLNEGFC